jgi:hypothetical protein
LFIRVGARTEDHLMTLTAADPNRRAQAGLIDAIDPADHRSECRPFTVIDKRA